MLKKIFISLILICCFSFSYSQKQQFIDFEFITTDNIKHKLSDYKTDSLIIYFYNPDCENCTKLKKRLSKDKAINKAIENKTLTVIALLPDVEREYWVENDKFIPENWINGWSSSDKELIKRYLQTVPTLFMLDKERNIIYKRLYEDYYN